MPSDDPETEGIAISAPDRATRIQSILGWALVLFVGFVTLHGIYRPLGPAGIDPGWVWVLNHARTAGLVFGRDIVFTYGPLGFLTVPLDVSSNLFVANIFLLMVHVLFTTALATLYVRDRRLAVITVFAVLFVVANHQGLSIEGFLPLVVGLLAVVGVSVDHPLLFAAASTLTAIFLLVKISLGVAAVAIVVAAFLVARFVFHRDHRFALGLLPLPTTLLVLAALCFDRPATFIRWLQLSVEEVAGYSLANSITNAVPGADRQVALGVIVLALWVGLPVVLRSDRRLLACNLIFAPVALIQFRLAFVRQDNYHQLGFVPFMLALIAVSSLLAQRKKQLAAYVLGFAALLFAGAVTHLVDPVTHGMLPRNLLTGGSGPRALSRLLHIKETRAALAAESAVNLESLRLGEDVRDLLKGSHNGVGTLPWEVQYCPANGFEWNPTPTVQLYSAYTRTLDRWSATHYAGENAPQYIINSFAAVGMRRQLFDAPATWRTVFLEYQVRSVGWKPEPALLLERRREPLQWSFDEVSRDVIVPGGASIPVPASEHLLFAEIDLQLNAIGWIRKAVFRVPMLVLVMTHQSEHVSICRLIPGNATHSLLINRFPRDFRGYRRLWQGVLDDPVVRVAISGDGTHSFRSSATVIWRDLRIASPTPPSTEGSP